MDHEKSKLLSNYGHQLFMIPMIQGTIEDAAWKISKHGFVATVDDGYYGRVTKDQISPAFPIGKNVAFDSSKHADELVIFNDSQTLPLFIVHYNPKANIQRTEPAIPIFNEPDLLENESTETIRGDLESSNSATFTVLNSEKIKEVSGWENDQVVEWLYNSELSKVAEIAKQGWDGRILTELSQPTS